MSKIFFLDIEKSDIVQELLGSSTLVESSKTTNYLHLDLDLYLINGQTGESINKINSKLIQSIMLIA